MSFDTLDLVTGNVFQVTWDLGRRCNYDCTYCPTTRHDNFSPHATLEQLTRNADFLFEYVDLYMQYRDFKFASISFTGGEPTVNPKFIEFVQYLKNEYDNKYKNRWKANFALTSNGAMSEKMANAVMENMKHITVSYHAESDQKLKDQVRQRILQFKENEIAKQGNCSISVNVMFHAEYFDECKELCEFLDEHKVRYSPRVIGEEPNSSESFAHKYNEEQLDYMRNFWKIRNQNLNVERETSDQLSAAGKKTSETKTLGMAIGRPCCGQRQMCLSNQGQSRMATFVDLREFKGWHCSVNWFFLHIEQQTDKVFHHQTCQAKFDGTRGHIGRLGRGGAKIILDDLKNKLETKTMPTIICPRHVCGCGLCSPKSKYKENYMDVVKGHIDTGVLVQ